MRVLVVGGAGYMAEAVERDLLEIDASDVSEITVADKAAQAVKLRVAELESSKVEGCVIDIHDHASLVNQIKKHDIVVNAASSTTTYEIAKAALLAERNLVTLLTLNTSLAAPGAPVDEFGQLTEEFCRRFDDEYRKANLIGVMGLGSMPGTSNVLGRYLGDKFDTIETMDFSYVYAHLSEQKTFFPFDALGMIMQYSQPALVFRDGKYVKLPPRSGRESAHYPEPIGTAERFYIDHTEATDFSRHYRDKGILNVGTKTGWSRGFLQNMEFLDSLGMLDLQPRKVGDASVVPAEVLTSGLTGRVKKSAATHEYGCMRLEIRGKIAGQRIEYTADVLSTPYRNLGVTQHRTGIPAAIGVHMIARGSITSKGCYSPDYGVDPEVYFHELQRRRIQVSYSVKYLL